MLRIAFIALLLFGFLSEARSQGPQQTFWALNNNGTFLLDQIGSTGASVAYSVRKLRKGYTGYAMRVRQNRSGTDPQGDVAFDANNQVSGSSIVTITTAGGTYSVGDKVSFSSFYSGYSVYVVTWYDQSGNGRNVTQATTSQQPRIVNAGTLETSNSKASIRFINSSSTVLSATVASATMFGSGYIGTASLVIEASSGSTSSFGYSDGGTDRWQAHIDEGSYLYFDVGSSYNRLSYVNSANVSVLRNYALVAGSSKMEIWVSGTKVASSTPAMSASTTGTFNVGGIPLFPGSWYHDAHQSEIIIFPLALSTSEIGILENNQKSFYSTP
ncbi:hypothetical protein [Rurimicrobium arvi]|uniref:F5/8 type C domain-containing protein n=1 Tax=Rurimicrobium arvi TaxID=2049916 RepID=A0ABP8MR21_9BACT